MGLPVILYHESEAHIITIETKNGDTYRGMNLQVEDNMNTFLRDVTRTTTTGKVINLDHMYIRGDQIRFAVVPDMLSNAPMFKRVQIYKKSKGRKGIPQGIGRGRAAAIRAKGGRGGGRFGGRGGKGGKGGKGFGR